MPDYEAIRKIREIGVELLRMAEEMQQVGKENLRRAQSLCDHANMTGVECPDCGLYQPYDFSDDPDGPGRSEQD